MSRLTLGRPKTNRASSSLLPRRIPTDARPSSMAAASVADTHVVNANLVGRQAWVGEHRHKTEGQFFCWLREGNRIPCKANEQEWEDRHELHHGRAFLRRHDQCSGSINYGGWVIFLGTRRLSSPTSAANKSRVNSFALITTSA